MILRRLVLVALLAGVCVSTVRADKADKPVAVVEALSVPEDLDVAEDRSSDEINVEYVERNGDDQIALESSPDQVQERSDLAIVPVPDGYLDTLGAPQASAQTAAEDRQDNLSQYGAPVQDQDSYGVPAAAPIEDGYGSPAADPISDDGYGAPQAPVYAPQRPTGPVPVPLPLPVNPASIVIPQGPNYGPPKPKYRPRPPPPKRPVYRPPPQKRPPPPKRQKRPPPPKYRPPPQKKPQYKPKPLPPKPSYKPAPPKYKPKPAPAPQRPAYKPQQKRPPPPKRPIYKPQKPKYSPPPPKVQPQYNPAPAPAAVAKPSPQADEPWPKAQPDMPKITSLDVTCEKNLMKVFIEFDKPFYGIIFSKGHYSDVNCVHLPAGLGRTSAKFDVSINSCGTIGNTENGLYGYGADSGSGTFFENTIVVQYDPQVQEVWDQARKLRCTWHDQYEKSVTFRPFPVDMLDVVRADFAGDNVGCWMQIQVGKGPWASEVSGLVKIGQTMTMVLAIKDDEQKFDMMVRNCMAHDGKRAPIQLVDQKGCVTRPKLMSKFSKIKNFGASASVLSYAHFQAFKFPDSMEVHFQCTIQICRYQCPDQCDAPKAAAAPDSYGSPAAPAQGPDSYGSPVAAPIATYGKPVSRSRREADKVGEIISEHVVEIDLEDVGVEKVIQVVSSGDLTFAIKENENEDDNVVDLYPPVRQTLGEDQGYICMSTPAFAATLVILLAILVISCLLSAFLCLRHRSYYGETSLIAAFANPVFAHKKGHF